ncbi:MAG: molybdopterin molybdotransferase MoeA [Methylobacteriaceae bacterium]|nr:molybdopterin molybdotransferase MoeA [Methylobacteriaceae bacterium]
MPDTLLPVEEALARVLAVPRGPLRREIVPLSQAYDRTLAADLAAKRTQPPKAVSAMDGYALRAEDARAAGARLTIIGESAAGRGFLGQIGAGETVRIFTGAPVPDGADTIIIQEDVDVDGSSVVFKAAAKPKTFIRPAGLDFREGEVLLRAGKRLGAAEVALAAAMNHAELEVASKPRVAILATGDELVMPGSEPGPDQIVASNPFAIAAFVRQSGGEPIDLGIATDDFAALERAIEQAEREKADVLVTLGGASVGAHDLVQSALTRRGMQLGFWRIAMRPGKPLIHGSMGAMSILGLPGNPVSSVVCAILFLVPLIRHLQGDPDAGAAQDEPAILGADLPANDGRKDYLRSHFARDAEGRPVATPASRQDSSMLRILADSNCLIVRAPHAPAAKAGDICQVLRLA